MPIFNNILSALFKRNKGMKISKEEAKLSVFMVNKILYLDNSM